MFSLLRNLHHTVVTAIYHCYVFGNSAKCSYCIARNVVMEVIFKIFKNLMIFPKLKFYLNIQLSQINKYASIILSIMGWQKHLVYNYSIIIGKVIGYS